MLNEVRSNVVLRRYWASALKFSFVVLLWLPSFEVVSRGEYLSVEAFLKGAFAEEAPVVERYWWDESVKSQAEAIVGHTINSLRMRYWRGADKTAWIIDEIGKERPITIGVVVRDHQIESVSILQFRESRGWEVRYASFTSQFQRAEINGDHRLSKSIDGITGATMSVAAVKRSAELALYLHDIVMSS